MALTRSSVENYSVTHLVDAAQHWNTSAQMWEQHFEAINQQANMVTFLGPAADGMRVRTGTDHATVIALSEQLRVAGHTATMGAVELTALHRIATTAIQAAESDDFAVGEDFSVQDRTTAYLTPIEAAERQAQGQAHAASIASAVTTLHTHDSAVAATIGTQSATLATAQFADGKPVHGGVQMAGHGFKTDGPVCDDPDYNDGIWRRFISAVGGGAMIGGITGAPEGGVGAIPGAIIGGSTAGILDLLHEATGDGPKCK